MAEGLSDSTVEDLINHARAAAAAYRLRPPVALTRGPVGSYLGSGCGTSIDFHDFREYQQGDDLRRVDWSAYARSDNLVLRLYREEIAPVVEIMIDLSRSMGHYPGKQATAIFIAAFIAGTVRKAEGRPILIGGEQRFPGGAFEAGLRSFRFTEKLNPSDSQSPQPAMRRPVRFFISDFLFQTDMEAFLRRTAGDSAVLVPILLLSDTERKPDFHGGMRFIDVEEPGQNRDLRVDRGLLTSYGERLKKHIDSIEDAARRLRTQLIQLEVTDNFDSSQAISEITAAQLARQGIVEAS